MRTVSIIIIAALALVISSPAGADPPERFEFNGSFTFPDDGNQLVVFVNTDRDSMCSPEMLAFEEALIDWIAGGQVGPPPPEPDIPDGFDPFQIQRLDIRTGAGLSFLRGNDVYVELWYWDDVADRGDVGPCLDSDDRAERFAVGAGDWSFHATDLEFTGTRAIVFDLALRHGDIVDADGQRYRYQVHLHDNVSCFEHAASQNACLVRNSTLQPVQN